MLAMRFGGGGGGGGADTGGEDDDDDGDDGDETEDDVRHDVVRRSGGCRTVSLVCVLFMCLCGVLAASLMVWHFLETAITWRRKWHAEKKRLAESFPMRPC